jgi:hypothetical protein
MLLPKREPHVSRAAGDRQREWAGRREKELSGEGQGGENKLHRRTTRLDFSDPAMGSECDLSMRPRQRSKSQKKKIRNPDWQEGKHKTSQGRLAWWLAKRLWMTSTHGVPIAPPDRRVQWLCTPRWWKTRGRTWEAAWEERNGAPSAGW